MKLLLTLLDVMIMVRFFHLGSLVAHSSLLHRIFLSLKSLIGFTFSDAEYFSTCSLKKR